MIDDQVFEWNHGEPRPLEIPGEFRQSYRLMVVWLTSRNYRVPEGLMEKMRLDARLRSA